MNFCKNLDKAMERLHQKGAFLTTKSGEKVNTMTISWGTIGYMWGRPVFMTMVRHSRYTYDILKESDSFTVSVPKDDSFQSALAICGTKSGRDMDKIKECGLTLKDGKSVSTPIIKGGGYTYECRVITSFPVGEELLPTEVKEKCYGDNNYHTFFYGEIVECYED